MSLTQAGIVIISDDILKDRKTDNISSFLIKELDILQYNVVKVTVIPARTSAIIRDLESMNKNCDIIIAVGENCSILYKAIGELTTQELHQSDELVNVSRENPELIDKEECLIPVQAKILHNTEYPIVHFQRIFILKEKYLETSFIRELKQHLVQYRKESRFEKVIKVCKNGHSNIDLSDISRIADNGVKIDVSTSDQFFIFKISSSHFLQIVELQNKIQNKFESYKICFSDSSQLWENIYLSKEQHVRKAIENIEKCLTQYGPENIFVSFNGGKDCTVLLHLILAVMKKKYPSYTHPVFCSYVQSENPFQEQDEFIRQCQSYYNLNVMTIRSGIKDALKQTLDKNPNYKACLMGTRRTDPFSRDLNVFQITDAHWPQIMRVSPLLDWHYSDIWDYLLYYKVPYCKLYDMGFTSLGNTVNTTRNPSLIDNNHQGTEVYLPAYKLLKETKERNGRNSS